MRNMLFSNQSTEHNLKNFKAPLLFSAIKNLIYK